jgi:NADH-quinone oxidoreductase subunit J
MNTVYDWISENRTQAVVPVFGFIALYLLLPRESRFWRPAGIAFGVVTLCAIGFLCGSPATTLNGALFYVFAGVAVAAAAATVTFPNPIYSALSFAIVVLSVSGLFLLRGALFLAATTVIIYAGAIVVTFLFIIMLSRHPGNAPYDRNAREPFLASLAAFLLLSVLLFTLVDWKESRLTQTLPPLTKTLGPNRAPGTNRQGIQVGVIPVPRNLDPYPHSSMLADEPSPLRGLGRTFFTDYLFAVELAGTLLLVAGVGAVAIAPRRVRLRVKPPAQ